MFLWRKEKTSHSQEIVGKRLQEERGNLWSVKTIASWMFTIERGNPWNRAHTHSARIRFSRTSWYWIIKREQVQLCNRWGKHRLQHLGRAECDGETITWHQRSQLDSADREPPSATSTSKWSSTTSTIQSFQQRIRDAIIGVGNTELCEIVDVEPKSQCRACLTYWDVGIVYCTCGHFLRDDTTENKKYISSVLDLFAIPNFFIRKGRPHGHRYGKKEGCKEFHTAKQLQKRCRKKQYENIHDRFIRGTWFRKTMIELGRSEDLSLKWTDLQAKTTVILPQKKKLMYIVAIGGSVRIWWILTRCR